MPDSAFILDFLPDFYRNFMVDDNGQSLLTPILDNYLNAMGDQLFQAQQISQALSLETTPWNLDESFVTIDTSESNRYKTGYKIDSSIVRYNKLYFDGKFTHPCSITYTIFHDLSKDIRYLVFNSQIDQNIIFVDYCSKDIKILQKTFGKLLRHEIDIPNLTLSPSDVVINFLDIESQYAKYRNQLTAIQYGLMHTPTPAVLNSVVGIYSNLPYAPFDGIITRINSNTLDIQDDTTGNIKTLTCLYVDPALTLGQRIKKYTILEKPCYRIFDIYSKPARFASFLLGYFGASTNNLLYLNKGDSEQDASLYFDSFVSWDCPNVYWDMGHNFGNPPPPTDVNQPDIPSWEYEDSKFIVNSYFVDPGFVDAGFVDGNTQLIFEMFRNLIIFEYSDANISQYYDVMNFTPCVTNELQTLLRRIIETHTKIKYIKPMYFVEPGFVDVGFVD